MATAANKLMTAEELERVPDDGYQYELIEGVVHRMAPASFEPSSLAARVLTRIGSYVEEGGLGEVTGADGGYVLGRDPDTVLAPDVAFVRAERVPSPEERQHFALVAPDLVVEVVSPSDRVRDVDDKVRRYVAAGVPVVWVFDPRRRTVTVQRPNAAPLVLGAEDVLEGEDALPGFRLPLSDLFR